LVKTKLSIVPTPLISEPILERQRNFAEVFFREHVLIPDDELEDAKLVGKREVDRKFERGIFGVIDGIDSPLRDGCLLARAENRYDDETEQRLAVSCGTFDLARTDNSRIAGPAAIFCQQIHAAENLYLEDDDGRFAGRW